jgi:hypothetical protein
MRLTHKAEHAVDMESGTIRVVTSQAAELGDATTVRPTLPATGGSSATERAIVAFRLKQNAAKSVQSEQYLS